MGSLQTYGLVANYYCLPRHTYLLDGPVASHRVIAERYIYRYMLMNDGLRQSRPIRRPLFLSCHIHIHLCDLKLIGPYSQNHRQ